MFDVHPKAKRLRDGREVPFDGVANLAHPPEGKGALSSTTPSSSSRKGKGGGNEKEMASVAEFEGLSTVKDPGDFDVFRKDPGEIWEGEEGGVAAAKVSSGCVPRSTSR